MFAAVDAQALDPQEASARDRLQRAVGPEYEVRRLLGRGGFAEVFEAWEPRLVRRVAIKTVRSDAGVSKDELERFQREARAMAGLRHPNLMEIYTVGEAGGVAYFVMPLVEGESLKARIQREGALAIGEVTRILVEAAGALAAAHAAGTVHRDVKPDNIMLEGRPGRVLLTDFGIAKALEADTSSFSRTSVVVGTPAYMSPEQGTGETVDHRSDIYSLGVVAFEMVTGRPPFQAKSVQAMVAKHLTEAPPSPRTLRPECPAALARLIARCLAKDPGARWQSMSALIDALESGTDVADPTSVATPEPASAAHHAPVRALRRRVGVLGGLAFVLAAMDVQFGLGGASAWAAAAALGYLAASAGRLWRQGYEWRDLVLGWNRSPSVPSTSDDASGAARDEDFGRFGSLVRSLVSDRAAILSVFGSMYHQEQHRLRGLQPAVDGLVTRAKHLARKVVNLESRIGEAAAKLDRPVDAVLEEAAGQEPSPLARRAARVHELGAARDDAARELRACIARLEDLRDRLSEGTLMAPGGIDAMARTVAEAEAYLSQRAI